MRSLPSILLFALVCILLLNHCNKDAFGARPFVRLITHEVTDITDSGATFVGELVDGFTQTVTETGFLYSTDSITHLYQGNRIKIKLAEDASIFIYKSDKALIEGQLYFVRSYLITNNHTVFGNIVSFTSMGSKPPIIVSVSPQEVFCGDTLKISGRNFSPFSEENKVKLNDYNLGIISALDTIILAVAESDKETAELSLSVSGMTAAHKPKLKFFLPKITDVYPLEVGTGDTITVSGENLHAMKNFTFQFGNFKTKPLKTEQGSITFQLTEFDLFSPSNIIFNSNCGNFEILKEIIFKPPQISTVIPSIISNPDQIVSIQGKYFNSRFNGVLIKELKESLVHTIVQNDTLITFKLPSIILDGITKTILFDIYVMCHNSVVKYDAPLKLEYNSYWTLKNQFPGSARRNAVAFSLNGNGYFGLGNSEDGIHYNDFWKYDPQQDRWTQQSSFPGKPRSEVTVFHKNNKAYVGLGRSYASSIINNQSVFDYIYYPDFYSFDPATQQWERIADFPAEARIFAGAFTIHDLGYVTGGTKVFKSSIPDTYWETIYFSDTYHYDFSKNSWGVATNSAIPFPYPSCVEYKNSAFIFDQNGFFNFDGRDWIKVHSKEHNVGSKSVFRIEDKVYMEWVGDGGIFEFELEGYKLNPTSFRPNVKRTNSIFVIYNKAYLIGSLNEDALDDKLWQFDPSFKK